MKTNIYALACAIGGGVGFFLHLSGLGLILCVLMWAIPGIVTVFLSRKLNPGEEISSRSAMILGGVSGVVTSLGYISRVYNYSSGGNGGADWVADIFIQWAYIDVPCCVLGNTVIASWFNSVLAERESRTAALANPSPTEGRQDGSNIR